MEYELVNFDEVGSAEQAVKDGMELYTFVAGDKIRVLCPSVADKYSSALYREVLVPWWSALDGTAERSVMIQYKGSWFQAFDYHGGFIHCTDGNLINPRYAKPATIKQTDLWLENAPGNEVAG
jgi:hypothetical protein